MILSSRGLALIKEFEALRLKAYKDIAGVWTIGYGHTSTAHEGQEITEPEALALLKLDLGYAEYAVNLHVHAPLGQNQYDALVSLAFNIGGTAFKSSTLLRRLNAENYPAAAEHFLDWRFVRDPATKQMVESAGLLNRRTKERALFLET